MRRLLLLIVRPLTCLMDKINIRIGKPRLNGVQYNDVMSMIRPGDIVLTRNSLRPSNLFIPGYWSHVHMVVFGNHTIEARLPKVAISTLVDVWASASSVMIVRPCNVSAETAKDAADAAISFIGIPYDSSFEFGDKAFYCSELVYKAYRRVGVFFDNILSKVAGKKTIIPSAFESEGFIVLFDSRKDS